jgi:valyl-tRNA synthetase
MDNMAERAVQAVRYIYIYIYVYIYIYIYVYMCVYISIYMYIYICMYVCIYNIFLYSHLCKYTSMFIYRSKEITIIPDRFEKVWYNWLENIHDWCVSRQLWWGHRIPAYYVEGSDKSEYVIARSLEEAQVKSVEKFGKEGLALVQDDDVLDTWFSSGLWPFATVGWPLGELLCSLLTPFGWVYVFHVEHIDKNMKPFSLL